MEVDLDRLQSFDSSAFRAWRKICLEFFPGLYNIWQYLLDPELKCLLISGAEKILVLGLYFGYGPIAVKFVRGYCKARILI